MLSRRTFVLLAFTAWVALVTTAQAQAPDAKGLAFFEQKIRPVLVEHCYSCHSAEAQEKKKLQASLFLDSQEGTLNGGETGPALVKGKAAESLLIKALKYDGMEMPPAGKLPDAVIADFEQWINMGAPDPRQGKSPLISKREIDIAAGKQFWSFKPLAKVEPPEVKDATWVRTPIDRFILVEQEKRGLKHSSPADASKLLRRVSYDLVGLPPESLNAENYDAFVDKLLASEHYGERWGRHWLDVVRYAESGGYEFDGFRPGAYHYRDWVIKALNADLPYNEFIRLQVAGDKLKPNDYETASAAGFLVAGPYPGQITAKTVERIRYDQLDDMIMTMGGSMLGLTLGCVRCHEHKYDPFPQQDYYGIAAALARTSHGNVQYDPDPAATEKAVEKHRAEHEPFVAALKKFAETELPKRFDAWQKAELPKQPEAPRWQVFDPVAVEAERSWLKMLPSGIVAHDGSITPGSDVRARGRRRNVASNETYRITVETHQKNIAALRLDAFTDKALPARGPGLNTDGSFQLGELVVTAKPLDPAAKDAPVTLKLKPVFAAFEDKDQPLAQAVDGKPATAWVVKTTAKKDNAAVFEIEGGLPGFAGGTELKFELQFRDFGIGRLRLALSVEPNPATWAGDVTTQHVGELRAIAAANKNAIPPALAESATRWFSPFDADTAKVFRAERDHAAVEPRPPFTDVYTAIVGGQDVYYLRRGEVDNKQGVATPAFVQVLDTASSDDRWLPKSADKKPAVDPRIGLANWMTDAEAGAGHLLARVIVNRLWHHHFGEGLVSTPNDFGAQGDRPSHPELLDWLAGELIRNGWRLKPLHKLIVTSAVYMQGQQILPANVKIDPENRYLWHFKPRRLEAEVIRDALLAVGGTLDAKMYGPSVLDNTARRSVYLRVKRSELIPFMTMFDAPEPTQSIGERISTTVPTQALAMMNSPFVRQQAEKLAARIRPPAGGSLDVAIDRGYEIVLSRQPTGAERQRMLAFVEGQKKLPGNQAAASDQQALVEFCQVLLCLNEFIYVD